jgi:starch phosphorylase
VPQTVSPRRIEEFLARSKVRRRVAELIEQRRRYLAAPAWYQQPHGEAALTRVADFSMEFALSEALPIYLGGLRNVAGDRLK